MLDFLLDDNSEDNAESEITAFMKYKFISYNTVQIIYIPGYVMSHS
jgi:hypothetical protein